MRLFRKIDSNSLRADPSTTPEFSSINLPREIEKSCVFTDNMKGGDLMGHVLWETDYSADVLLGTIFGVKSDS